MSSLDCDDSFEIDEVKIGGLTLVICGVLVKGSLGRRAPVDDRSMIKGTNLGVSFTSLFGRFANIERSFDLLALGEPNKLVLLG